jgi:drug/metabolite transporter (DMT)-like permease
VIVSLGRITALGALWLSVTCVVVLHLLRVDLAPVGHRLSEYANGPHGWIMTVAFVTLGVGLLALGIALRAHSDGYRFAWIGPLAAISGGFGMVVAGAFKTGGSDSRELVHSRASALGTIAIVILALAFTFVYARLKPRPDQFGTALALAGAMLVVMSSFFHETRWTGLSQRILWLALVVWLLRTAWRLRPEKAG